ncbi:MAG: hypothetical protein E7191_07545 [Erysipelotrichaceae bacterium]|nr:hypothetical protein [Erysipelotrichaceae bacterium]
MIVLDLGLFCHSKRLRIPGTEDMEKEYTDPWFHVRGACVGVLLGIIVSLLAGGMMYVLI